MTRGNADLKVLVADDATAVAERMTDLLTTLKGVTVVGPASDGREALRLFRQEQPECALLDLDMPGMSGLEVLCEIRATSALVKVFILTNHVEPSLRDRCIAAGADEFLHKAKDFERVLDLIGRLRKPSTDDGSS
jgi:CheY-like chemotaxis protein